MTICAKCGRPYSVSGRRQIQNAVCTRGGQHDWRKAIQTVLDEEFDCAALARLRKGDFDEGGEA